MLRVIPVIPAASHFMMEHTGLAAAGPSSRSTGIRGGNSRRDGE